MDLVAPRFERSERLVGARGMRKLRDATVAVFGLGGVGSFCAEALARSGVGSLRLVDHDVVSGTNCNRQLHALTSTLGRPKVEVVGSRLSDVNPALVLDLRQAFLATETADALLSDPLDWVVDAIDALGPKVELLHQCQRRGVHVVTALGAGSRLDPTKVVVVPLDQTKGDPFASRVRKLLRRRGPLAGVMAVVSVEPPRPRGHCVGKLMTDDLPRGRQRVIQPSMVMVPAAMGLAAASVVVRALCDADSG